MSVGKGTSIREGCYGLVRRSGIAYGQEFTDAINTELLGSCIIRRQISGVMGAFRRIHGQYP
jgi:hypothetical protein